MREAHRNKSAVEVKACSTPFRQHEPGSAGNMLQHSNDEDQNVDEGVQAEEE